MVTKHASEPPSGQILFYNTIKMAHVNYLLDADPGMNIIEVMRRLGAIKWQAGPEKDQEQWSRAFNRVNIYMKRYLKRKAEKKANTRTIQVEVPDSADLTRKTKIPVQIHPGMTKKLIEAEISEKIMEQYPVDPQTAKKVGTITRKEAMDAAGLNPDKPPPTFREWRFEHYFEKGNPQGRPEGWYKEPHCWWDPFLDGGEGGWVRGKHPWEHKLFYWQMEFLYNPAAHVDPHPYGHVHKKIGQYLEHGPNLLQVWMSRDHLKTTYIQRGFCLYTICEHPDTAKGTILLVAWDGELSEETFDAIVEQLAHNKKILSFYGYLIDDEKKDATGRGKKRKFKQGLLYFRFQETGSNPGLKAISFQSGKITGRHPALTLMDDIEDEPLSEAYMKRFKTVFLKKLMPAASKGGRVIITGTLKGYDETNDIYLLLEKNELWTTLKFPAVRDKRTGEPAMPPMDHVQYKILLVPKLDMKGNFLYDPDGKLFLVKQIKVGFILNEKDYELTFPERFTLRDIIKFRLRMRYGKDTTDDDFFSEYQLIASNPSGKVFNMKRVFEVPPKLVGVRQFVDFRDFHDWCKKQSHPVYLWIDPGGKDSHGIAIIVMAVVQGQNWGTKHVILDAVIMRKSLDIVAAKLAHLLDYWNVNAWGVEGNFDQAETYGETLQRELYRYTQSIGRPELFQPPRVANNTVDKAQRINTHMSTMIGYEDMAPSFFLNPGCEEYERVKIELRSFGFPMVTSGKDKHQFDLLDATVSVKLHMLGTTVPYLYAIG